MASIDVSSARMKADVQGAAPGTDIAANGRRAVFHLTRNAEPVIGLSRAASDADASAVAFEGTIDVQLGPRETLNNFRFGFIQLALLHTAQAVYAGKTSAEGSMAINYATPPAYPTPNAYEYNLDSDPMIFGPQVLPFTNIRAPVVTPKVTLTGPNAGRPVPGVQLVKVSMDDHPSNSMNLAFKNQKTGMDNYLVRATTEKSFVTAFVVRDNSTQVITPLHHVSWHVRWHARYSWNRSVCRGAMDQPAFDFGAITTGPPTDVSVAAKITNPERDPDKCSNALTRAAIRALDGLINRETFNISVANRWPPDVPANFWQ